MSIARSAPLSDGERVEASKRKARPTPLISSQTKASLLWLAGIAAFVGLVIGWFELGWGDTLAGAFEQPLPSDGEPIAVVVPTATPTATPEPTPTPEPTATPRPTPILVATPTLTPYVAVASAEPTPKPTARPLIRISQPLCTGSMEPTIQCGDWVVHEYPNDCAEDIGVYNFGKYGSIVWLRHTGRDCEQPARYFDVCDGEEIGAGDIISFSARTQFGWKLIMHRVIERFERSTGDKYDCSFRTQGDANEVADDLVRAENVVTRAARVRRDGDVVWERAQ